MPSLFGRKRPQVNLEAPPRIGSEETFKEYILADADTQTKAARVQVANLPPPIRVAGLLDCPCP